MPGNLQHPAISPDDTTVAIDRFDPQTGFWDVWLHDLSRGTASRLTFDSKNNNMPIWSPDGSQVAFASTRDGGSNIYQKATNGAAPDELLDNAARTKLPLDWSRDGRYIIELVRDTKTKNDIWVLPLFGDRKPFPYLQGSFNEGDARLSPNGRWLAYASDETTRVEIYVQSFPMHTGKWQISNGGGQLPVWSRDGKELYFVGPDEKLMAIEVNGDALKGGSEFKAGVPRPLFQKPPASGVAQFYGVTKDGRFLIPVAIEQKSAVPMTVVVNWTAALKRN
jgi:Tol biopolymer transport system component